MDTQSDQFLSGDRVHITDDCGEPFLPGKFVYDLPENLIEVHELYLEDEDWCDNRKKKSLKLNEKEYNAIRSLVLNQKIDWETLFEFFRRPNLSLNELLMGPDFFRIVMDCYNLKYNQVVFSDFLWTMRSIYLPLFHTLLMDVPKADLYHCVATGYAGVLGSMAHYFHRKPSVNLGTWNLHQRAGRGINQGQMGQGHL